MNKKALILLVSLIVLIAAGASFWRWEDAKKAENKRQVALEQQRQATEEMKKQENIKTQEEAVDTNNWKTYRDEDLGFEFKYPEEININPSGESVSLRRDCSSLKNKDLSIQMRCDLESSLSFSITPKTINQVIESYKGDCQQNGHCFVFIASQENYVLDDIAGKKLIGNNAEGVGALNYIYATNKDKNYIISFVQLDDVYSSVLSTFRFIK